MGGRVAAEGAAVSGRVQAAACARCCLGCAGWGRRAAHSTAHPHPPARATPPRPAPRSWLPTNFTAGEVCQMTNTGDLPETFLLVGRGGGAGAWGACK